MESTPPDTAHSTRAPGMMASIVIVVVLLLDGREGCVLRQPHELERAGLAVAVFEDDCLGEVRILALLVIIPVAVEREHDVRVLLDGAGLTEVGQHRALVLARLVGTRQLRQADDRNIELLGHDLEHAAHVGDGLRGRCRPTA